MRALLQRVTHAHVSVDDTCVSSIETGILVFIGIEKCDTTTTADKMIDKLLNYRIFNDSDGKMNLNVAEVNGKVLAVSQFTLAADTKSGTRAGFSSAMPPALAKELYGYFTKQLKAKYTQVAFGIFAADMQISLTNDGPISFILEVK